jgi:hypothetical protein
VLVLDAALRSWHSFRTFVCRTQTSLVRPPLSPFPSPPLPSTHVYVEPEREGRREEEEGGEIE